VRARRLPIAPKSTADAGKKQPWRHSLDRAQHILNVQEYLVICILLRRNASRMELKLCTVASSGAAPRLGASMCMHACIKKIYKLVNKVFFPKKNLSFSRLQQGHASMCRSSHLFGFPLFPPAPCVFRKFMHVPVCAGEVFVRQSVETRSLIGTPGTQHQQTASLA
jgi:hypothetical protein